jgi:outer membrane immunogenic protein
LTPTSNFSEAIGFRLWFLGNSILLESRYIASTVSEYSHSHWGNSMKKLAIALTAIAALTGSALAADMTPRPYTKAAPMATPVTSWTGCYIGGGGGGAVTKNDHHDFLTAAPFTNLSPNLSTGADGWFGTVQVGCDYQFNNFVVGIFGDYDFMDVKGDISSGGFFAPAITGSQTQDSQWAVGGRAGYLVLPQLLTYVSETV